MNIFSSRTEALFNLKKKRKEKQSRSKSGASLRPSAHLAVFAHGQTSQVTQQIAQVLFKQTGICQVLPSQVHKLVGVHHLAWREKMGKITKSQDNDSQCVFTSGDYCLLH